MTSGDVLSTPPPSASFPPAAGQPLRSHQKPYRNHLTKQQVLVIKQKARRQYTLLLVVLFIIFLVFCWISILRQQLLRQQHQHPSLLCNVDNHDKNNNVLFDTIANNTCRLRLPGFLREEQETFPRSQLLVHAQYFQSLCYIILYIFNISNLCFFVQLNYETMMDVNKHKQLHSSSSNMRIRRCVVLIVLLGVLASEIIMSYPMYVKFVALTSTTITVGYIAYNYHSIWFFVLKLPNDSPSRRRRLFIQRLIIIVSSMLLSLIRYFISITISTITNFKNSHEDLTIRDSIENFEGAMIVATREVILCLLGGGTGVVLFYMMIVNTNDTITASMTGNSAPSCQTSGVPRKLYHVLQIFITWAGISSLFVPYLMLYPVSTIFIYLTTLSCILSVI